MLWDSTFFTFHTYVLPMTTCLAHSNSCLNPVVYCFLRPEPWQVLVSSFRVLWSRLWPQSKACMEQMALKEVGGRWVASTQKSGSSRTPTNTTEHLHEGCSLNTLLSETYQGQSPQILGRSSCSLSQAAVSQEKSDL